MTRLQTMPAVVNGPSPVHRTTAENTLNTQPTGPADAEPSMTPRNAADVMTGAMIALVPTETDAARLATDGGEPVEELHLTLWFLGDADQIDTDTRAALVNTARAMVEQRDLSPLHAKAFGANLWNPDSDHPAWVLAVGDLPEDERPDGYRRLAAYRLAMEEAWHDAAPQLDLPPQHSPWSPHVCVGYSDDPALLAEVVDRLGPVTFDRIRVAFAGEHTDIPLGGADKPLPLPGEPALGPSNQAQPVNREYHRDRRGRFAKKPGGPDPDTGTKPDRAPKTFKKRVGDAILGPIERDEYGDAFHGDAELEPDVVDAVKDAVTIEYDGLSTSNITVRPVFDQDVPSTLVSGEIVDSDGQAVGRFERRLYDDDGFLKVEHSLLTIDGDRQGQGFAQAFNNQLFDWYRASHVQRVTLTANIDVGGYAWARAGYDWADAESARGIRARLAEAMRRGDDRIPPDRWEEQRDLGDDLEGRMIDYQLGDDEFPLPYDVANLGRWPGAGKDDWWLGKVVMMHSRWEAVRDL